MDTSIIKRCQLCSFLAPSLKFLLKHIRQVHAHKPGFRITCSLSRCPRTFTTFEVFRNHVYGFHSDNEATVQPQQDVPDNEPTYDAEADADDQPHILDPYKTKKAAAAIWILKVQENYMLPQSTMEQILKDVTGFFQDTLLDLQEDVNSCLSSAGIDHSSIPGLAHLFDRSSEYAAPFAGLETHYRHMKYCKEVLGYVVCIQSVFMVYTWYTCYYLTCYSCQFQ